MSSKVHPAVEPIQFLIGRWESESAAGQYPTIKDFAFREQIEFESIGQPLLNFSSKSWHPVSGAPMHRECGFLRIDPESQRLAFMVSHNFGLTSLEEGELTAPNEISLESRCISRMSFAKEPEVTGLRRRFRLSEDGKQLEISTDMRTNRTPFTNHLLVNYKRVE